MGKEQEASGVLSSLLLDNDLIRARVAGTGTKGGDDVSLLSDLGLDIVRQPVDVVAGKDLAARHGSESAGGPHLLDVVVIVGVDNGRDIKVGSSVPATKVDLTEHARDVLVTLLDGIVVANVVGGELDSSLLLVADSDGINVGVARAGSEVDGADLVVEGPKGHLASSDGRGSGSEGHESSRELHFDGCVCVLCFGTGSKNKGAQSSSRQELMIRENARELARCKCCCFTE